MKTVAHCNTVIIAVTIESYFIKKESLAVHLSIVHDKSVNGTQLMLCLCKNVIFSNMYTWTDVMSPNSVLFKLCFTLFSNNLK